jgi:hypothetical protein
LEGKVELGLQIDGGSLVRNSHEVRVAIQPGRVKRPGESGVVKGDSGKPGLRCAERPSPHTSGTGPPSPGRWAFPGGTAEALDTAAADPLNCQRAAGCLGSDTSMDIQPYTFQAVLPL